MPANTSSGPCGPLGPVGTGLPPEDCSGSSMSAPTELHLYMYQGDDVLFELAWLDATTGAAAEDLTGADIKMQVREDNADAQPAVLFECSVGDGITITDGPAAEFSILVSSTKTLLIKGLGRPYLYDIQVTPVSTARKTTIFRGGVYYDLDRTR